MLCSQLLTILVSASISGVLGTVSNARAVRDTPLYLNINAGTSRITTVDVPFHGSATIAVSGRSSSFAFPRFLSGDGIYLLNTAHVVQDVLRLKHNVVPGAGAAYFASPVDILDFEVQFSFRFHHIRQSGSGWAFLLHNDPAGPAAFGDADLIGYTFVTRSVAVEIDTKLHPEHGDPSSSHLSIHTRYSDANDIHESYSIGSARLPTINQDDTVHSMRIRYSPGLFQVFFDADIANGRPTLEVSIDLAASIDWLNSTKAWIGFVTSGLAGSRGITSFIDVLSWNYTNYSPGEERVVYTPACGYTGPDTVAYELSNGTTGFIAVEVSDAPAESDCHLGWTCLWAEEVAGLSSEWGNTASSGASFYALGPYDLYPANDSSGTKAWSPRRPGTQVEFLELSFRQDMHIQSVGVVETLNPGNILAVKTRRSAADGWMVLWETAQPNRTLTETRRFFRPPIAPAAFASRFVRLELTQAGIDFVAIDAVQICGALQELGNSTVRHGTTGESRLHNGTVTACSGDIVVTEPIGVLTDHVGPSSSPPNLACSWTVLPFFSAPDVLRITIVRLGLNGSDILDIYSYTDADSTMYPLLSHSASRPVPFSTADLVHGNHFYLEFTTGSTDVGSGFEIHYAVVSPNTTAGQLATGFPTLTLFSTPTGAELTISANRESNSFVPPLAGGLAGSVLAASLAVGAVILVRRRRRKRQLAPNSESVLSSMPTPRGTPSLAQFNMEFSELVIYKPEIGRGAFGAVYRAKWRGAACVVKIAQVSDEETRASFEKEINCMRRMTRHPNIVLVLGSCIDTEGRYILCMEYVDGGALASLLQDASFRIDRELAKCLCAQIAAGMRHLHADDVNILHCDLAARNVLVYRSQNSVGAKVADFGLSHVANSGNDVYMSTGSLKLAIRWAAPELLLHPTHHTKAGDVWAYGVVVWEILERDCQPYGHRLNHEVVRFVLTGGRLPRPAVVAHDPLLDELMKRCFSNEASDRPTFKDICTMFLAAGRPIEESHQRAECIPIHPSDIARSQPPQSRYTQPPEPHYTTAEVVDAGYTLANILQEEVTLTTNS